MTATVVVQWHEVLLAMPCLCIPEASRDDYRQHLFGCPYGMARHPKILAAIQALIDDPCETCGGTGTVKCWSPGGPCPDGQAECECCGPCRQCPEPRSQP